MATDKTLPDPPILDCDSLALEQLRREIHLGIEAAAAGQFSRKTAREIADEVRREHRCG